MRVARRAAATIAPRAAGGSLRALVGVAPRTAGPSTGGCAPRVASAIGAGASWAPLRACVRGGRRAVVRLPVSHLHVILLYSESRTGVSPWRAGRRASFFRVYKGMSPTPEDRIWSRLLQKCDLREHLERHEPAFRAEGGILALFYRFRNYDEQKTYGSVKSFARFRFLTARWPPLISLTEVRRTLHDGSHWILPGLDSHGRVVVVLNLRKMDTVAHTLEGYQQTTCFLMETIVQTDVVQRKGIALIVDMSDSSLFEFSYSDATRGVRMMQDAFPCKLAKVWVLHANVVTRSLGRVVTSLLKPKLRERVTFVCNASPASLEIDAEHLPTSMNGRCCMDSSWAAACAALVSRQSYGGLVF